MLILTITNLIIEIEDLTVKKGIGKDVCDGNRFALPF